MAAAQPASEAGWPHLQGRHGALQGLSRILPLWPGRGLAHAGIATERGMRINNSAAVLQAAVDGPGIVLAAW